MPITDSDAELQHNGALHWPITSQSVCKPLTYNGVKLPAVHGVPQNVKANQSNLNKKEKSSRSIKLRRMNTGS